MQTQGLPYFPISRFYIETFGGKVYKIPVSVAQTCPNREGLKGMQTCNFCDVWGSAAYPEVREQQLREQILGIKARLKQKYKASKFLVYFQAYTNTFARTSQLRSQFEVALQFDDVVGFVVGTRPDCISDAVFDLWSEYSQKTFLSIEIGAQTFNEDQLKWMRRGHTAEQSIKAIKRIKARVPAVDLGVHLMFGCPGETEQQIINTAELINSLPIDNVKLHNLHVLKNTPLALDYEQGLYTPLSRPEYTRRVMLFLQHLDPKTPVHRMAAVASRHDELVAPDWTSKHLENYQYIISYLLENNVYQGQYYKRVRC